MARPTWREPRTSGPMVIAGLAKLAEEVKKHAAPI
jgi:hypothetical protein